MSKNLLEDLNGFYIASFYGGEEEGACLQFAIGNQYAQFTRSEVKIIIKKLKKWNNKK